MSTLSNQDLTFTLQPVAVLYQVEMLPTTPLHHTDFIITLTDVTHWIFVANKLEVNV